MKVIFLEDVTNLAKAGDTKDVSDGYARHYLLPRKLAVLASTSASRMLEIQKEIKARQQAITETQMEKLAGELEGKEITIRARAGAKSKLYGSVTAADIAAELEKAKLIVDKRKIDMSEPIHELGIYEVVIKLGKDLAPKIRVDVAPLEEEEAESQMVAESKAKTGTEGETKTETA
ncbi:MAG: 50S ribosomal protein L9 [Chloroflexi bacterium]|nr:50S ribosomal protein L9 [Chloroflexota bacterium]